MRISKGNKHPEEWARGGMMNTERFELTQKMANVVGQLETDFIYWREVDRNQEGSDIRDKVNYVIAKVLSLLEPVELEVLGNEEINKVLTSGQFNTSSMHRPSYAGVSYTSNPYQAISQATVRKNQRRQLYRVKE